MDDEGLFAAWFGAWKPTRPEMTPLGWYDITDLETAFNAGIDAEQDRVIAEILGPERAEKLLRPVRRKKT